jgi:hypothetical protein
MCWTEPKRLGGLFMRRGNEDGLSSHRVECARRYAARAPNGERGMQGGSQGGGLGGRLRGAGTGGVEWQSREKIPKCASRHGDFGQLGMKVGWWQTRPMRSGGQCPKIALTRATCWGWHTGRSDHCRGMVVGIRSSMMRALARQRR